MAESQTDNELKGPSDPFLLIDGDIFLYRCGFAVEKTKYLVEHAGNVYEDNTVKFDTAKEAKVYAGDTGIIWSRKELEPVENALQVTKSTLNEVFDKFWPDSKTWQGQIYLTGKGNFRDLIEADRGYKDNRDPSHRPKHYRAIKQYLIDKYKAIVVNGEEADDAIGRAAYSMPVDRYVIISNDKDLDQLSGFHYDWTKRSLYYVNDEDAAKMFYRQLLAGDATDNIKGVMSDAKAKAAINECGSLKDCTKVVEKAYREVYGELWGDKVESTGELVWIRRGNVDQGKPHNPFWDHYSG